MLRLKDKTAVITGGANGIGAVAAALFGQQGAQVAILDFDEQAGEAKAQELRDAGVDVAFFKVDVSDNEACQRGSGSSRREVW